MVRDDAQTAGKGWWRAGLLTLGLCLAVCGCFGVSHNPGYFPYLCPGGDIIRTHAKPPGEGFFANFDPHACRLEVRPIEATNPVMTQHVIIATVYDETGTPRRKRRVEWMLEGVGNIVEVDESGWFPGRGYKVDNRYAVSYTDCCEHRITRGNDDPTDDFVIRPGQTWCVITSAVEGDSKLTVYAPEIHNWEHHKVFVTKHWVDAEWRFPLPAVNKVGTEHVFTTSVLRHSDKEPLAGYRVRYKVLDGPPAIFLPGQCQETIAVTDLQGHANVTLMQVAPQPGINHIGVEVIRPPDPCLPSGPAGVVIGRGETHKEWVGPQVNLKKEVPPVVVLGGEVPYTLTVSNPGKIETQGNLTLRDKVPEGLQYVRSDPPASVEGDHLLWSLAALPAGGSHAVRVVFKANKAGEIVNCAEVSGPEGLKSEHCVPTTVTIPQLAVTKTGPTTAVLGAPVTYQITVTNPGNGPASNVVLTDTFDEGLEHESKARSVTLNLGDLPPGQSKTVNLSLIPRQMGVLVNRVVATADGGLTAKAEHPVTVQKAQLAVDKTGPTRRITGRPAEWKITVTNPGEVALNNVVVRDQLPPELTFVSADNGGVQSGAREVVWNLGTLQAGENRVVTLITRCDGMTPRALNVAVATADPGLKVQAEAPIEIQGLPAYRLEVVDTDDPVEVGARTKYTIDVLNQGSLPGNQVQIIAELPPQLRFVGANGPSAHRLEGPRIVFAAVDSLPPGSKLSYTVEVEALEVGDVRFRTELRSSTLREPVIEEESTRIYKPLTENRPPAGPPPDTQPPPVFPNPDNTPPPAGLGRPQ